MTVRYIWLISLVLTMAVIMATGGCTFVTEPVAQPVSPVFPVQDRVVDGSAGAVDAALMWSQKYQQLAVETEELKSRNNQLARENDALKQQQEQFESQLAQTNKQLAEAEQFILQSHQALVAWKSDVLGFRDEMRNAASAQLQALGQILKILGAETTAETIQKQDTGDKD